MGTDTLTSAFHLDASADSIGINTAPPAALLDINGFYRWAGQKRVSTQFDKTSDTTLANVTGQRDAVKWPGSEAMEFVVGNSPLSRASSTARQLSGLARPFTDPQMKGQFIPEAGKTAMNLLTGARVTNVSPAAQESLLRERVQQMMRQAGGKTFIRSYIPEEVEAEMTPQELEDSKKLEALINTLSKRAKVRAEARKAAEGR